jgi:hypothetical protein
VVLLHSSSVVYLKMLFSAQKGSVSYKLCTPLLDASALDPLGSGVTVVSHPAAVLVIAQVLCMAFGLCTHLANMLASLGFDALDPLPEHGLGREM